MTSIETILKLLKNEDDFDHVKCNDNNDIRQLIVKYGEGKEDIVYSDIVIKINRYHKAQERILLITNKAIYNIEKDKYKQPKRRIDIKKLDSITMSSNSDDFVLHVKDERDYHYRTPRRYEAVSIISQIYNNLTNELLIGNTSRSNDIRSIVEKNHSIIQTSSQTAASKFPLAAKLRQLVSKKKKRYKEEGFDLDLSYITDRLIAMGYPSEDLEGLYRNPYSEVYRFLETRHQDHYKVYNLCSERRYDTAKFHNRVGYFPFDDHNCPPFVLILSFCQDVSKWLARDANNIAAIHCKAGKGRTGLMISCYLLWCGLYNTANDSLNYFAQQRTKNKKGVTIPSQKRYVHYFEAFLREYYAPKRPFLFGGISKVLVRIALTSIPHMDRRTGGCTPYIKIASIDGTIIYDSREIFNTRRYVRDDPMIVIDSNARISGDIKLIIKHESGVGSDSEICHLWFHTSFIPIHNVLRFELQDIDKACKDKKGRFDSDFAIELTFRPNDVIQPAEKSRRSFIDSFDLRAEERKMLSRKQDHDLELLRQSSAYSYV